VVRPIKFVARMGASSIASSKTLVHMESYNLPIHGSSYFVELPALPRTIERVVTPERTTRAAILPPNGQDVRGVSEARFRRPPRLR